MTTGTRVAVKVDSEKTNMITHTHVTETVDLEKIGITTGNRVAAHVDLGKTRMITDTHVAVIVCMVETHIATASH